MREIMISIQPQWVEKILNGNKTIEIRKTMPKCELPCKVYIYCTKSKPTLQYFYNWQNYKPISEHSTWASGRTINVGDYGNGKVVAEFTLNEIEDFSKWEYDFGALIRHLDLFAGTEGNYPILINYLNKQCKGFAWHIDNLKIYDKPKELSEFSTILHRMKGKQYRLTSHLLQRPPQSWCYVEELENE